MTVSSPLPTRRRRVIVDTDAKNEADDQYAIVHALLTPMFDLRGLVAAQWGHRRSDRSMLDSRAEIDHLLELMDLGGQVTVANGAAEAIPLEDEAPRLTVPARRGQQRVRDH